MTDLSITKFNLKRAKVLWHRAFLEKRSSISLSAFRIAVAMTVGLHVIPTLVNLPDNYLQTAFKTYNPSFFTANALHWVQQSPDGLVYLFTAFFFMTWFFFLIGFFSQVSCILMTVSCYYFYALNAFHVGTLSWDILLVTLFLMCVTNYHGDYFSADCLLKGRVDAYQRKRPFFIQRLLQLQLAATFFYTALYKTTAEGNWLTDNPVYYLVNYPPEGVVKLFLFKEWLQGQPALCYGVGVVVVGMEYLMPFLLFIRRTRRTAILMGITFHILLILTMDVPAIFFWLFPAMFLLFIHPDAVLKWIETGRERNVRAGRMKLLYDGRCGFCRASVQRVLVMDLFHTVEAVDYHTLENPEALHPGFTREKLHSEIHLLDCDGESSAGFFVFRRLALKLPMLYPFLFLFYLPGAGLVGPFVYRLIANNRYLFHWSAPCRDNACRL